MPSAINTIIPTFSVKRMTLFCIARKLSGAPTLLLFLLLFTRPAVAEIIPADRLGPWQGNVGVPGGIPNRTIVSKNVVSDLGADPTGLVDASAIIENAIKSCPANRVIYLPAGTFKIATGVHARESWRSNYTVRGAGMGQTILKVTTGAAFDLGNPGSNDGPFSHAITAGATKGSNTITVDNTVDFVPGQFMAIQPATPVWAHILAYGDETATRIITVTLKVRSKTSNTVTFDPPCPFDFSDMNPIALAYDGSSPSYLPIHGVGIEDMTFDLSQSQAFCAVKWTNAWGCWMKNTEVKGAYSRHVYCDHAVRCEFRGLYHHDTQGTGPGHEGLDFITGSSWNLVEDSIFINGGAPTLILGDGGGGCVGNVFAYNYFRHNSDTGYYDMSMNHGAHNMLNLAEGNNFEVVKEDGYYGSCSHNTYFRNRILDRMTLNHYTTYYNVVGNVLGLTGLTDTYEWEGLPFTGFAFYCFGLPNAGNPSYTGEIGPTDPPDYHLEPWHLQDNVPAGSGPGAQALDHNVKATLLRHGNFDYVHNDVVWDDTIPDHTIPPSLYYSSTPSWWPEEVPWPPIGPDRDPMVVRIPAELRYAALNGPRPGAPAHLRVLP